MTPASRTAVTSSVMAAVGMVVAGTIGVVAHQPWLFPSLGATLMVLAETPDQPPAKPRNVLAGHAVGILAGWLALAVTGLLDHPSAVQEGITWPRVAAAAVSLVITAGVVALISTPHPPAGATTLIISLGILTTARELLVMAASIGLVLLVGLGVRSAMTSVLPQQTKDPSPAVP